MHRYKQTLCTSSRTLLPIRTHDITGSGSAHPCKCTTSGIPIIVLSALISTYHEIVTKPKSSDHRSAPDLRCWTRGYSLNLTRHNLFIFCAPRPCGAVDFRGPSRETDFNSHARPLRDQQTTPSQPPCKTTSATMSTAELAASYAALILADESVEITVRSHHRSPA